MTILAFLLGLIAYHLHLRGKVVITNRELIDIATAAHQRGSEQGFDNGFLAGTLSAEKAREEGRL